MTAAFAVLKHKLYFRSNLLEWSSYRGFVPGIRVYLMFYQHMVWGRGGTVVQVLCNLRSYLHEGYLTVINS